MKILRATLVVVSMALCAFSDPQVLLPTTISPIPTTTNYRLEDGSQYQQGCFPPCMCPMMERAPVRGAFKLTFAGGQDSYMVYKVKDIQWTVSLYDSEVTISGSGVYRIHRSLKKQELKLDLKIGDEPVQNFQSGKTGTTADFPKIDITVSINGMYCIDTAITVVAAPVPPQDVVRYSLNEQAAYEHGCWDPCDCPSGVAVPMSGSFALAKIADDGLYAEYAVSDVDWKVSYDPIEGGEPVHLTGSGRYRVGGELAVEQQLVLDLLVNGNPQRFDSGLVAGGGEFPTIDALVSINGLVCLDTALTVIAKPNSP